ncbi:MAG: sodium-translocating pyrophosphatase [Myxococcota bacterium]|nr:sodium-translocating pyrophosphatase [Myxococcota bacterium]
MIAQSLFFATPVAGVLALAYALTKTQWVNKHEVGTDRMREISTYIREGAMAFLNREYKILAVFAAVVAVLLAVGNATNVDSHWLVAVAFLGGAFASGLAGYFGMRIATAANVRTTNAARQGLPQALSVAFSGGTVMGMSVVGLGVIGVAGLTIAFSESGLMVAADGGTDWRRVVAVVSGFSMGASSIALFARVGGGIFTKAADVGADLVGKVEAGIPEDDPRNPAVIADNVGDNVGDVAGMGADLFESYVGSIIAAMALAASGWFALKSGGASADVVANQLNTLFFPLLVAAIGIVCSIAGTFFVRTSEGGNPQHALDMGMYVAGGLMIVATYFAAQAFIPAGVHQVGVETPYTPNGVFIAIVSGLLCGILIGKVTEYYTSDKTAPVHAIADASQTGAATNIISGLALGMKSTAAPIILIVIAILLANTFGGLYGIAMAALGMLSTTGIQLAVDAYGPIADNAGGIAEMAGLEPGVREKTDKLDAVGNTTAAIGKGFAIGSAALTALALFGAYTTTAGITSIDVSQPIVLSGVFIGAMLPFLFSALAMTAVGEAAFDMINEVRRQFKEIPGLMEGKATADHAKCVDIATSAALKRMLVPGIIAVTSPVIVGFYDAEALAGLLVGVTVSGVLLAIFQSNAGGAWDNAKKYIEGGQFGGKGSESHKAAVCGDTVGDPFKDTSGPALNILVKLMSVVALVIAPLI